MQSLRRVATSALVAISLSTIALPVAHAVPIDWVTVGNPGNSGVGSVSEVYRIMKFEFTTSQYTAFLNAVDPDGSNPQNIWNSSMGSDPRGGISFTSGDAAGAKYAFLPNMGNKPVSYVSWFSVARVANWLHNGAQTSGTTNSSASAPQNTGAYSLGTVATGDPVARNSGALVYLPTQAQWFKAASYNPTLNSGTGGYLTWGNGFDTAPTAVTADSTGNGSAGTGSILGSGTGNFANFARNADWNAQDGNKTTVGTNGGPSYYGCFDMSGNISEWNDLTGVAGGSRRGQRGGFWQNSTADGVRVGSGDDPRADSLGSDIGFRLVSVPEPSTSVLAGFGIACAGWGAWRRRRAR